MFQPQYTLIDEWPDRRDEEGTPVIRAIRTMTNHLPELKTTLLELFHKDINDAFSNASKKDGTCYN
jgi:hypothetical protein